MLALLTNPSATICQQTVVLDERPPTGEQQTEPLVGRSAHFITSGRCLHTGKASADENLSERDKTHRRPLAAPEEKIRERAGDSGAICR